MLALTGRDWSLHPGRFLRRRDPAGAFRRDVNEMGEAPVLLHEGRSLSQSGVILDYLAERTGRYGACQSRRAARDPALDPVRQPQVHRLPRAPALPARAAEEPESEVTEFLRGRTKNAFAIVEKHLERKSLHRRGPADHRRPLAGRLHLLRGGDRHRPGRLSPHRGLGIAASPRFPAGSTPTT